MSTSYQKSGASRNGVTPSWNAGMLGRRGFLALMGAGALGWMNSPGLADDTKLAALIGWHWHDPVRRPCGC